MSEILQTEGAVHIWYIDILWFLGRDDRDQSAMTGQDKRGRGRTSVHVLMSVEVSQNIYILAGHPVLCSVTSSREDLKCFINLN